MTTRLTNFSHINSQHNTNFTHGSLSEFEEALFNGEPIDHFDVDDVTILNSLCKYYEVEKNDEKYLEMANRLIEKGDNSGYFRLGCFHKTKNNIQQALHYWKLSGDIGNALACFNIGANYMFIEGNFDEAERWFEKSYEIGGTERLVAMNMSTIYGQFMPKQNYEKEIKWLNTGINFGSKECLNKLLEPIPPHLKVKFMQQNKEICNSSLVTETILSMKDKYY